MNLAGSGAEQERMSGSGELNSGNLLVKSEGLPASGVTKSASGAGRSSEQAARLSLSALLEPGMAARRRQDHATALAHFMAAAAEHPDVLEIQFQIATTLCRLGRLIEATDCCEKIARHAPGNDRTMHILGLIARQRKEHQTALGHFNDAASARPQNITYFLQIAQTLRDLGRLGEARSYCANILEREPRHFQALSLLGNMAWSESDYRSALLHFQAAAAADPQNPDVQLKIGLALGHLGQFAGAEACLRELAGRNPQNIQIALALSGLLRQQGRASEALQIVETAAAELPQNKAIQLEIGHVLVALQRFDEAKCKFQKLLEDSRDDVMALLGLANVERKAMEWAAALAHFQEAAALRPDDPKIRVDIASMLAELLRFKEANEVLRACEEDPGMKRDLQYQIRKLRYYCERMEFDKAEQVAVCLPSNRHTPINAVSLIAGLYAERGRWNDILDLFRERIIANALPAMTGGADILFDAVAAAARRTGRYEEVLDITDGWSSPESRERISRLRDQIIEEARLLESLDLADRFPKPVRRISIKSPLRRDRSLLQARVLSAQSCGPAADYRSTKVERLSLRTERKHTIYYCTDAKYLLGSAVSLFSLLRHNPQTSWSCHFIIYCPPEIIEAAQKIFASISAFFDATIDVRNAEGLVPENSRLRTTWGSFSMGLSLSEAAYYRIYAARQLLHENGQGRALYIDSDTCVGPGVETLLKYDMSGMPIAARSELVELARVTRATQRFGIEKGSYFNSGVLLFDLAQPVLEAGLVRSIKAAVQKQHLLICLDQCALNIGFKDWAASLDEKCNFYLKPRDDYSCSPDRPIVMHFLGHPKPWDPWYDSPNCMIWFDEFVALGDVIGAAASKDLLKHYFLGPRS